MHYSLHLKPEEPSSPRRFRGRHVTAGAAVRACVILSFLLHGKLQAQSDSGLRGELAGVGGGATLAPPPIPIGGITPPPQAVSAGYKSLAFDDEFSVLNLAPSPISSANHNWYPGIWFEYPAPPASLITMASSDLNLEWSRSSSHATGLTDTTVSGESANASAGRSFRYGYFEASMKWNPTTGAWPAFWMQPVQALEGSQTQGEIDIFEGQGGDPTYYGTLHTWSGASGTWYSMPNNFSLPRGNNFNTWHTYGMLWTPGTVSWYYDNVKVGSASTTPIFDQENFFLLLSMQEGANWTNGDLTGVTANTMDLYVHWVRVWQ
jgi:glycosyl hydrolase family 16